VPRDTTGGAGEGAAMTKKMEQMKSKLEQRMNASEKLKKLAHILKITVTPTASASTWATTPTSRCSS
jgi:chemotaxis protein MotB